MLTFFSTHHFSPPWWGVWHQRRPLPAPSFSLTPPFYSFPIWSASLTAFAWTSGRGQGNNPPISHSSTKKKHLHSQSKTTEFGLLVLNKTKHVINHTKNNDLKDWWTHTFVADPHLFERKLKLSCVKEELEEDSGVVFRVNEHLVFNLTQSFVVWIVG